MGKRSAGAFARRKHDLYRTWDPRAVAPLLPHLPAGARFFEPCAGDGDLIELLKAAGLECAGACDIDGPYGYYEKKPGRVERLGTIAHGDATKHDAAGHYYGFDFYITNPPWTRDLLHAIILNLYWQRPTWLLFDADWAHTLQARPYMPLCRRIVSVGRVRWMEGTDNDGKDNAAWHLFAPAGNTDFIGRAA